jgi:hypothetical protein
LGEAVVFDKPIVSDNSGQQPELSVLSTTTNTIDSTVEITRTWVANDACANTSSVSQTLTFMPAPKLEILALASGKAMLRWLEHPVGFHLECRSNSNGGQWAAVPGIPTVIEGMNHVVVDANASQCLFRLARPFGLSHPYHRRGISHPSYPAY